MLPTATEDPELALFISTTRAFLDREVPLDALRDLHRRGLSYERVWWRQACELGWTSLLVPDELGGGSVSGDGVSDLSRVSELLGRNVAPGPLAPVSAVVTALAEASTASAHLDMLTGLIDGSRVGVWAVDEPGRPFGAAPDTDAAATGDGFLLNGIKDRVEAARDGDFFLVTARTDDGQRQFVVPSDAAGVTVTGMASVDLVRDYASVRFHNVHIPPEAAVGTADETPVLIERQTHIVQLLQCAETVGVLDAVFDMTIEWVRERHSFGRPLASYQALKHRLADMKMQLEGCRAVVDAARLAVGGRTSDAALVLSAAKAYVGEYSVALIQDGVQLHGGIGVTWEHNLHLYLRRAEVNRALCGTTEEHHERVYAHYERLESVQ